MLRIRVDTEEQRLDILGEGGGGESLFHEYFNARCWQ